MTAVLKFVFSASYLILYLKTRHFRTSVFESSEHIKSLDLTSLVLKLCVEDH